MLKPTIHMNGTGGPALLLQLETAIAALGDAFDAVCAASPNARDYYTQGPDAWPTVQKEWEAHCTALRKLMKDLAETHEHVYNAVNP